ncbi:hypothetical protein QY049_21430, partial [Bradyrhizobium sp. WYCCWR 13022]
QFMPGCIAAHSRDAQVGGSCRLQKGNGRKPFYRTTPPIDRRIVLDTSWLARCRPVVSLEHAYERD